MKILFLLHCPPPIHGAAMVGHYIMKSSIVNDYFDCSYINLGTSAKVDEIGQKGHHKFKRYIKILSKTFKILRREDPGLVYITLTASGIGFYKDALIVMLVKAFGKKVVFHFHNKGIQKRQHNWLANALYKIVFKNAEVILLSKYLYYDIEKYVPMKRVYYCANGIPENKDGIVRQKKNQGVVEMLFLSNFIESKGIYTLLKACQLLKAKKLPFYCTFIGSEGDITVKDFQEKVKELGVGDCVHYAGRKYGLEKERFYSVSDIFVFPTYYHNECFPLVLLEAMQFSLPVVSTFEGGIQDIVEDGQTGYLVKQRDTLALAEKLELLILDQKLRLKMGSAGRKVYEENYTLAIFEQHFLETLKKLVVEKEKKIPKVLFMLHYPPPVHGAAMVGQYIMQSTLVKSSFDCRFINSGTSNSVDEIGQKGWKKLMRYFEILGQTFKSLNRFDPNLVYLTLTASGIGLYKDALMVILAKAYGKKVVFHFHNKGISKGQDNWFNNLLYRILLKNSEVILLSKNLYYDIEKYVDSERVRYCANGIPEREMSKSTPKALNKKVQLLFLSNLIESKGVYILLEACKILKVKQLPFQCTFVGSEGDITSKDFEIKIEELNVVDQVQYMGRRYGLEKERFYSESDIFVFPTYNDCFPLVLLEAMQFSLPVVSTFEGGISDIVENGETGFLVQPKDAESLADKLELLILNRQLRLRMGETGRKRYSEKFTIEVFEQSFSKIVNELA